MIIWLDLKGVFKMYLCKGSMKCSAGSSWINRRFPILDVNAAAVPTWIRTNFGIWKLFSGFVAWDILRFKRGLALVRALAFYNLLLQPYELGLAHLPLKTLTIA